ncbi:unnamed protein product [Symbiodinium microadriaticum]|nr:unnamed protein product [Symbiodinium microadriaticum]
MFDEDSEVLVIDTVGDILMDNASILARYRVLLHLTEEHLSEGALLDARASLPHFQEQKTAVLVTGMRPH